MIGLLQNYDLEGIWEDSVLTEFKALYWNLLGLGKTSETLIWNSSFFGIGLSKGPREYE
jgi:hypothetical protein